MRVVSAWMVLVRHYLAGIVVPARSVAGCARCRIDGSDRVDPAFDLGDYRADLGRLPAKCHPTRRGPDLTGPLGAPFQVFNLGVTILGERGEITEILRALILGIGAVNEFDRRQRSLDHLVSD